MVDNTLKDTLTNIFENILPQYGYNSRMEQSELAQDILTALQNRSILLSEAGVGIGKTHAYLIAATLIKHSSVNDFWIKGKYPNIAYIAKMPIVVATSSIALQNAIVKNYIPKISKILLAHGIIDKPLTAVIRKGKDHYICDKRLGLFWHQCADENIRHSIEPLIKGKYGIDLDEMNFLPAYIKRRINVSGGCDMRCNLRHNCRYRSFMEKAQSDKVDFQICNHNYLLADTLHRAKGQRPLIPHFQAVIIDEAHKFLPSARQMYGMSISKNEIEEMCKSIRSISFYQGHSTADLIRDTEKLIGQGKRLFTVLLENVPNSYIDEAADRLKTNIDTNVLRHLRNIEIIAGRLITSLSLIKPLVKYESLCRYICRQLESLQKSAVVFQNHKTLIYWLEQVSSGEEYSLCAIPKQMGEQLCADLWGKGVPIILTSGTLSASGSGSASDGFTHVKQSYGLSKVRDTEILETARNSPFNYRENALIYISENVPFPDGGNPQYISTVADELHKLIIASHGHSVVLFTSYKVMEFVFEDLQKRELQFPLHLLARGKHGIIEQFRKSQNGVLFACGSIWEGIDLPGDILSLLVIVKLPFAVPDPIADHEQTLYPTQEAYKNAVVVPEMLVKLKQGFGRLIRTEKDTGVVAILDSRVRKNGAYRKRVLDSMPDCNVTSHVESVRNFIKEKKSPAYFNEGRLRVGKDSIEL